MIDWPSERVKPGGVFHMKKASYSKDTESLLKVLMEEAKLSNMQRRRLLEDVRNGSALPKDDYNTTEPRSTRERCFTANFRKSYDSRRRSLDLIKSSGAYETNPISIGPFREPVHLAKKRLQEAMSGIKGTPRTSRIKRRVPRDDEEEDGESSDIYQRIQELLNEISERANWLDKMEQLGQGRKHRGVIQSQITEKLNEIKRLEKIQHELVSTRSLEDKLNKLAL